MVFVVGGWGCLLIDMKCGVEFFVVRLWGVIVLILCGILVVFKMLVIGLYKCVWMVGLSYS